MIPISKKIIEPKITTNINFIDSLEEFEKLELDFNETILRFDNNQPCFYVRERDKYGEYSSIKVYYYENFADRVKRLEKDEFIEKCHQAGLDELKTKIAVMFFVENKKPYEVWEWSLINTNKN